MNEWGSVPGVAEGALELGLGLNLLGADSGTVGSSHPACWPGGGQARWALWGGPGEGTGLLPGTQPEGKRQAKIRHGVGGSRHAFSVFIARLLYAGT